MTDPELWLLAFLSYLLVLGTGVLAGFTPALVVAVALVLVPTALACRDYRRGRRRSGQR